MIELFRRNHAGRSARFSLVIAVGLLTSVVFLSCETSSTDPTDQNLPPEVARYERTPSGEVSPLDVVQIEAELNDVERTDTLFVRWNAGSGLFLYTVTDEDLTRLETASELVDTVLSWSESPLSAVQWISNGEDGEFPIRFTVEDQWEETVVHDTITVNPDFPTVSFEFTTAADDTIGLFDTLRVSAEIQPVQQDTIFLTWWDDSDNGRFIVSPDSSVEELIDTLFFTDHEAQTVNAVWYGNGTRGLRSIGLTLFDRWSGVDRSSTFYVDSLRNHAPSIPDFTVSEDDSISFNDTLYVECQAVDADNDSLSYSWFADGGEFLADTTQRETIWTSGGEYGVYEIGVTVRDARNETSRVDTVIVTNLPPVIEEVRVVDAVVAVNDTVTLACDAYDPDIPDLELGYQWSVTQGNLLENNAAVVRWATPPLTGTQTVSVTVSDDFNNRSRDLEVEVLPTPFEMTFDTPADVDRWAFAGMLAGLGDTPISYDLAWHADSLAMDVEARSNYGTHGFLLSDETFSNGEFILRFRASDPGFNHIALLPKMEGASTFLMFTISFTNGSWQVFEAIDGSLNYLAQLYEIPDWDGWIELKGVVEAETVAYYINGEQVWSGSKNSRWSTAKPLGIAVSGQSSSGSVLFDDLVVIVR
ncbi:hypothetical protein GF324_08295 [bacterium]|nr:hypothetical protein [bacterium]